jgi:molybdenum cofactor synthesis domain-containing protein
METFENYMISIDEALDIVERETPKLLPGTVELKNAVGRILASDLVSDMELPPFDRSQMDGFAVRCEDVSNGPVELRIVGESAAGNGWDGELDKNEAVRIMTGARVPKGADAVQKVELTSENNGLITIEKKTKRLQNIVEQGSEIKTGDIVIKSGTRITENMVASLASFGYNNVPVGIRPRVSILATGSEIVKIEDKPGRDQIRNSNSWSLAAFARKFNADVKILEIVQDDLEGLTQTIETAHRTCDCLIISGGVSVGDYDFTKPALKAIGAEIFFERVALKPGKPTVFAKKNNKLIFGLPGNPVSVAVTFFVFVRMALLQMQGASETRLKGSKAVLRHDIKGAKGRDAILPVTLSYSDDGRQTVETLRFSGSSNFVRFAGANGLVFVERDSSPKKDGIATVYRI